jgi:hypothetical protein
MMAIAESGRLLFERNYACAQPSKAALLLVLARKISLKIIGLFKILLSGVIKTPLSFFRSHRSWRQFPLRTSHFQILMI